MLESNHPNYRRDENDLEWLDFGDGKWLNGPAATSENGKVLLTVKEVGTAKVHDIDSGEQIGEIKPKSPLEGKPWEGRKTEFKVFIESAALNRNGDRALLGLNDSTAGLFDVATGDRLYAFGPEGSDAKPKWGFIRAIAFSPDCSLVTVGFSRRQAGVWRVESGELLAMLRHPASMRRYAGINGFNETLTTSVSISSDNHYAFAEFGDMSAVIWEVSTARIVFDAFRHTGHVVAICETAGGLRWATTCGEVWQVDEEGEPVKLLESGEHWWEAVFNPLGDELITRRSDKVIKKWWVDSENTVLSAQPSNWRYTLRDDRTIAFDKSGEWAAFPEGPDTFRTGGRTAQRKINTDVPVKQICLSPSSDYLVTIGDRSGVIELWNVPSAILRHRLQHEHAASCCAISQDGKLIAVGSRKGLIRIWNTDTGAEVHELAGDDGDVSSIAFGPDNSWLVSTGFRSVRYHDLQGNPGEPTIVRELRYEDLESPSLAVLSNGVVLVFREKCIEAWDRLEDCVWKSPIPHHRLRSYFRFRDVIHIDPGETRMVVGLDAGRLGIWSLADGKLLRVVSQDIPRPGSVGDLFESGEKRIPFWGNTMWDAPGGPYFHVPCDMYGNAVHLPRSADGRFTLIDLDDHVAVVDLDGKHGVVQQMPFRGYAKLMSIADGRLLAMNKQGELFSADLQN